VSGSWSRTLVHAFQRSRRRFRRSPQRQRLPWLSTGSYQPSPACYRLDPAYRTWPSCPAEPRPPSPSWKAPGWLPHRRRRLYVWGTSWRGSQGMYRALSAVNLNRRITDGVQCKNHEIWLHPCNSRISVWAHTEIPELHSQYVNFYNRRISMQTFPSSHVGTVPESMHVKSEERNFDQSRAISI